MLFEEVLKYIIYELDRRHLNFSELLIYYEINHRLTWDQEYPHTHTEEQSHKILWNFHHNHVDSSTQ